MMLVGPKRSGKGTIARILTDLIGKANVAGPTLSGLGTNFGLAPLIGKPLAIIDDARLSGKADASVIAERLRQPLRRGARLPSTARTCRPSRASCRPGSWCSPTSCRASATPRCAGVPVRHPADHPELLRQRGTTACTTASSPNSPESCCGRWRAAAASTTAAGSSSPPRAGRTCRTLRICRRRSGPSSGRTRHRGRLDGGHRQDVRCVVHLVHRRQKREGRRCRDVRPKSEGGRANRRERRHPLPRTGVRGKAYKGIRLRQPEDPESEVDTGGHQCPDNAHVREESIYIAVHVWTPVVHQRPAREADCAGRRQDVGDVCHDWRPGPAAQRPSAVSERNLRPSGESRTIDPKAILLRRDHEPDRQAQTHLPPQVPMGEAGERLRPAPCSPPTSSD